jgi:hypothetical protein
MQIPRKISLFICLILLITVSYGQQLQDAKDTLSYSLGLIVGKNILSQGVKDLDHDQFIRALSTVLRKEKTDILPSEAENYFRNYQERAMIGETEKKKLLKKVPALCPRLRIKFLHITMGL